ncbi:unnamed protein product, partial [Hydatigera taeniaeformis]|uniref:Protein slender lobes n=1 Tax=Hydatigena taeniaeformis TaxID=6205 RepID=A0A0R3XDA1_HYDTA
MHVPSPSKQKHKSPLPKSRRQKRTSKSGHSESSISEKREEKESPDSLLNYLNIEDVSAPLIEGVTTTTTLAERFKGMHIAKKHPMQIIPSPTSVAETAVPPLEKLEPRSPWKPSESNQEEVNVEKHPMQIISAPTNVQASAVPTVEKMESCTSEIPLRPEEERMDTEAVGVPASPPSKNERLEEEHQSFAAVVEQTVATEASPVVESLHIVKKHPMQIIPSPTTVPESSVTSGEKVEPQRSAKPLESNQEDGDAVVTGVASSSSPPVEHTDDQQPSTVEPEQTAQPLTEGKSETAAVDVTESLRIVQKHPMHIIPTPTNVLKSAAPLTSEEKLEVTQTAEAVPTTTKEKQNLVKTGAKSTKSIDKKRGKKTPITIPTIETTTVLETEPKTSPLPNEDTKAEAEPLINVEMDISPSTAEVVNSENLTTEHQEASGKASPSSLDKKRSKTSPLGCTKRQREKRVSGSEPKETSFPTPEPTAQPIKQHQLSDVEKASSSPDRKEGNTSPLLPVEEKAMLSSVNVD